MFIRKDWKSFWIVQSGSSGCNSPVQWLYPSWAPCSAQHPEPAGLPEQPLLPAQQCQLCSAAGPAHHRLQPLTLPLLLICPSKLNLLPQLPKSSRCTCLLTLGAAGRHPGMSLPLQMSQGFLLCTSPSLLLSSSPAVPVTVAVGATAGPCCCASRKPPWHGAPLPWVTAARTCSLDKRLDRQMCWGQGSLWAVTECLPSQSQPHPTAGHGSTQHRTSLHTHQLSPSHLVGMDVAQHGAPKEIPRAVVSAVARKSLHPCESTCGVNAEFPGLLISFSTPLLTPRTQPHSCSAREEPPAPIPVGFSPVSQDQALPKQWEGFTLLLSWLSPSNTALLALSSGASHRWCLSFLQLPQLFVQYFTADTLNSCSRLSFTACKYRTQMSLGNCTLVVFTTAEIKSEKENPT